MIYYGLTLNSNAFESFSIFVPYCFGKGMEVPVICLLIVLLLKAGRRLTLLILELICGVALLAAVAIPKDARITIGSFLTG